MDLLYWSRFIQDVKEGTPFFVHADWGVAAMNTRSLQSSLSRVGGCLATIESRRCYVCHGLRLCIFGTEPARMA